MYNNETIEKMLDKTEDLIRDMLKTEVQKSARYILKVKYEENRSF